MNEDPRKELSAKQRLNRPYMWLIIVAGALACVESIARLDTSQIDVQFLLLAAVTVIFGSRIGIQIPKVKAEITVSDTFIFLVMLLYSGEAAVLLAAADAFCSSPRFTKLWVTRIFNSGLLAFSTFLTASALRLCFGSVQSFAQSGYSRSFILAVFIMASVQYIANSGLAALRECMRQDQPLSQTWQQHFLWTSITYYAGASAAGMIAELIGTLGFYAFIVSIPIIAIIYSTYRTYRQNIETAELHAAEQQRISLALKDSEEQFRNAFDHAAGMALVSPDGHWLQVNNSLCQILGFTEKELLATNFQEVTYAEDLGEDLVHIYQVFEGKLKIDQREKRYLHKSGRTVWVLQSTSVARDAHGKPQHLILQIQDITERKRAQEQVHHAAFHDALTGLPNRVLLSDHLSLALARAKRRPDYQFAVLFLDLDRFKTVNDSLGHTLGDQLLVELSRRLELCVREMDTVARLGGDEFAVLVDGIAEPYDAIHIAERIHEQLTEPFDLNGHEFSTTASIGIAFSQTGYSRPEDILRDADTAMYRAKSNGKGRHEVFDLEMHARAVEMLTLERDLRRAVERDEIQVYFQPIVSLWDESLVGFEALARWNHSEKGHISPTQFIPVAEETGVIIPLGMKVLRQACLQLRQWEYKYPASRDLTISVNLSAKQFAQPNLVDEVRRTLIETKLAASRLRLEITESVIMGKAQTSIDMLSQLKALGVQLSIDDFGTGYSSLSYLHRFPVDILKIDRSFVSGMGIDKESTGIVETILTLAEKLDKKVVAEGVETAQQLIQLKALACEFGQGYLFSMPIDAETTERLFVSKIDPSRADTSYEGASLAVDAETITSVYAM